jgi:hypothetical protein
MPAPSGKPEGVFCCGWKVRCVLGPLLRDSDSENERQGSLAHTAARKARWPGLSNPCRSAARTVLLSPRSRAGASSHSPGKRALLSNPSEGQFPDIRHYGTGRQKQGQCAMNFSARWHDAFSLFIPWVSAILPPWPLKQARELLSASGLPTITSMAQWTCPP